jgi:hypothetical protein
VASCDRQWIWLFTSEIGFCVPRDIKTASA